MIQLDDHQYSEVLERIRTAEIKNDSLSIDLVDHLCCMIEERMELGLSYEQANEDVYGEMGLERIRDIEQETEFLTSNRIIMKRRTLITGLFALAIIIMAIVFQVFRIPYGPAVWMFIGMFIAIFGFGTQVVIDRFLYVKSSQERIKSLVGFVGTGFLLAGIAFHFAAWPFGPNLIIVGGVLLLGYFLIDSALSKQRELNI